MSFITENLGTIVAVVILAALLILDVRYLIHKKKTGGCVGCPSSGGCAGCSCACPSHETAVKHPVQKADFQKSSKDD